MNNKELAYTCPVINDVFDSASVVLRLPTFFLEIVSVFIKSTVVLKLLKAVTEKPKGIFTNLILKCTGLKYPIKNAI